MTREEAIERIKARFDKWALDNEDMKAIQTLIPELREDDDEKIRKEIVSALKFANEGNGGVYDKHIAYLEKLKKGPNVEEKPHTWTKHDEAVRKEAITCLQEWGKNFPINGVDYSNILYWLKEELSVHTVKPTEKPIEWSDTNELVFKDICKHLKEEGYNGWIVLLNALRNGEFQPKQEWSEEDEEKIDDIFEIIEHCISIPYSGGTLTLSKEYKKKLQCFLKSLRPQPKEEWSKEDKEMVQFYLDFTDYKLGCWPNTKVIEMRKKFRNWLKSLPERFILQPKQEWSEEDDLTIADLINYFEGDSLECSAEEMVQRIKSLRPSWKPSEEQMEALRIVLEHEAERIGSSEELSLANSLYEQLKALM